MLRNDFLRQIMKNMQHILLLLFLLFSCRSNAFSLDAAFSQTDSTIVNHDNSAFDSSDVKSFDYIFLDTSERLNHNPIQDSVLRIIEIEYTDLGAWFAKMDKLKKTRIVSPLIEKSNRPAWLVGILLLILISFGLVRIFFYPTFLNIIYGYFNERVLAQISKEDNVLTSWPYIFLYIIFSFSLGLFVVLYFSAKEDTLFLTLYNFGRISLVIGFLFVAKFLLIRIISVIFDAKRIARDYITVLYIVYFNSLLFLIPILILGVFLPFKYLDTLALLLILTTILLFSYRIIRSAFSLLGNLKFSIFYLILYLCALEIAPVLILVKSLNN